MDVNIKATAERLLKIANAIEKEAYDKTYFVCDKCNHTANLATINQRRKVAADQHSIKKVRTVGVEDKVACPACDGTMIYVATDDSERFYENAAPVSPAEEPTMGETSPDSDMPPKKKNTEDTDMPEDMKDEDEEKSPEDIFEPVDEQGKEDEELDLGYDEEPPAPIDDKTPEMPKDDAGAPPPPEGAPTAPEAEKLPAPTPPATKPPAAVAKPPMSAKKPLPPPPDLGDVPEAGLPEGEVPEATPPEEEKPISDEEIDLPEDEKPVDEEPAAEEAEGEEDTEEAPPKRKPPRFEKMPEGMDKEAAEGFWEAVTRYSSIE